MPTKKEIIAEGRAIASRSKLTIAGCARDSEKYLSTLLKQLHEVGAAFRDYQIIVVENDSKDATRKILEAEKAGTSHIVLPDFEDYRRKYKLPPLSMERQDDSSPLASRMKERVLRLATLRDSYLNIVQNSSSSGDYLLVLDFDLKRIAVNGIFHSLGLREKWDCITANGLHSSKKALFPVYYDTYALDLEQAPNQGLRWQEELRGLVTKKLKKLRKNQLFVLRSAFGGMALYRSQILHGMSYRASAVKDNCIFCEHVSLHHAMHRTFGAKIFINPQMTVYYNSIGALLLKFFSV